VGDASGEADDLGVLVDPGRALAATWNWSGLRDRAAALCRGGAGILEPPHALSFFC